MRQAAIGYACGYGPQGEGRFRREDNHGFWPPDKGVILVSASRLVDISHIPRSRAVMRFSKVVLVSESLLVGISSRDNRHYKSGGILGLMFSDAGSSRSEWADTAIHSVP